MSGLLKKTVHIVLITALVCTSLCVFAGSDGSPDGYDSWDDFYASLTGEDTTEVSDYVPEIDEMTLISNENNAELYFYEKENIFYLKSGEKLWSSIIRPDQIAVDELDTFEARGLFGVKVTDSQNSVQSFELSSGASSDFEITYDYTEGAVILHISIPAVSVSFDAEIGLDKNGLYCTIPDASIKETEEYKLMSVTVLPCFGAASVEDDGYIAYVDGSGALIDFSGRKATSRTLYSYQVWGSEVADLNTVLSNEVNDIHSLQMPVTGIKHTEGGCVTAVTNGAEIATLNILYDDYYNSYFSLEYRTFYSASYNFTGSAFDEKQMTMLSSRRAKGNDCTVRWFVLNGDKNTYSDMAVRYRNYLLDCGELKENAQGGKIPVSLDIFMSIEKSGLFGNSIISLTDYEQALAMLKTLAEKGIKSTDVRLMGWSKGGYSSMPTTLSDERTAGSFASFRKYCEEKGISLYKDAEFIRAYTKASDYNGQKDVLRDCINQIVTDKEEEFELLSARRILQSRTAEWSKKVKSGISLSSVGELLLSGNDSKGEINRSEALKSYRESLKSLKKGKTETAVVGGNSYVLPYADRLYDIPDNDSGYYQNTRTIPFYQMVVHGYTDYSSLAGNRSFDLEYQKLKWIETGSIPHYFVTDASSVEFQDTAYNTVFSSKFTDYTDIISQTSEEFNKNFGAFWYEPINSHEYVTEDVVRVVYGNDNEILINYGTKEASVDGINIPAKDYVVTGVMN